jgi:hypothetical protein
LKIPKELNITQIFWGRDVRILISPRWNSSDPFGLCERNPHEEQEAVRCALKRRLRRGV